MKRLALALILAGAAAHAEEAAPKPEATPVVAMAELPGAGTNRAYTAPGALPPVTAQLFNVKGQLELMPMVMVSLGDPFWRTLLAGVRGEHHIDERWSISAHALAGGSILSAPVEVCGGLSCSSPEAGQLRSAPGKLQMLMGAELGWAPVYGKLSLIGEHTLHFDAYISAGPELIREQIAQDAASEMTGRWAPGARFSLGERLFVSNRLTFRIAASELVYAGRVRGKFEPERKLSLETGLTWFFGGR